MFHYQRNLANYYSVDVNAGRLLAELVLIAVTTGVAFVLVEPLGRVFKGLPPNQWFVKSGSAETDERPMNDLKR